MIKALFLSLLVAISFIGCGNVSSYGNGNSYEDGSSSDDDSGASGHNQGKSCLSCHNFYSAATVYTALDATSSSQYASGYTLRAVLSNNQSINFYSGRGRGNFYANDSRLLSYKFTAQVLDSSGNIVNTSANLSHSSSRRDCNVCHTAGGKSGAPGRISTTKPSVPTTTSTPTTTTTTTSSALSFANDIMPLLTISCKGCHGGNGRFSITTASATYSNISSFSGINTTTPANSRLLTKSLGNNHGGGTIWTSSNSSYTSVKAWITQGGLNN